MVGLLVLSVSDRTWMVFLASLLISTFGMTLSCLRSIVSKLVDDNELGKCFAIISASETISDLIGAVLFIWLYHFGLSFGEFGRSVPFVFIAFVHSLILSNYFLFFFQQFEFKFSFQQIVLSGFLKVGMDSLKRYNLPN